jgi:hypothetical protein
VVRTVTAPPPTTPDEGSVPSPAPRGELPPNFVAVEGSYQMEFNRLDFDDYNIVADDKFPTESQWEFTTQCAGGRCTVEMRRELESGAFKTLSLEPAEGRPGVFEADSSGPTSCVTGSRRPETEQRYSIRATSPEAIEGRPTATRIEAYLTKTTDDGCNPGDPDRGSVSWKGALGG